MAIMEYFTPTHVYFGVGAEDEVGEVLKEYMERVKKADREALGERYETAKKEHTIVVFSVSMEDGGILTKDYEAIAGIIEELERAYDDVY